MTIIASPEHIAYLRRLTLLKALKLELKGMRRRGPSVYSIVKKEYGFTGTKQAVYDQLKELHDRLGQEEKDEQP